MADADLNIKIIAQDLAAPQLKAIRGHTDDMARGFSLAAGVVGTAAGTMAGFMSDIAREAAADQAAMEAVRVAVENTNVSWGDAEGEISAFIDAMRDSAAIGDDEMKPVLARLIAQTKDYGKAMDLASLAADVSRGAHIDLSAAANLVAKVAQGNTSSLGRYGIVLKNGATATEALGELQERFAGQAEAYGQTTQGQIEALSHRIGDWRESMGGALGAMQPVFAMLPGMSAAWSAMGGILGGLTPKLIAQTAATVAHTVATIAQEAATKVAAVAQLALNAAMSANPIALIIIAVVALAAAIIYLWNNSKEFRDFVEGLFKVLGDAVGGVLSVFGDAIKGLGDICGAVGEAIGRFAGGVGEAIGAIGGAIGSFPGTVGTAMRQAGDAIGAFAGNLGSTLGSAFGSAGEALGRFVANFGSTLAGLPALVPDLVTAGGDLVRGLADGMTSAWNWISWNIKALFDGIANLLPSLFDAGLRLIESFWDGVKRAWEDFMSWIRQRLQDLGGLLRFGQGISSLSLAMPVTSFGSYGGVASGPRGNVYSITVSGNTILGSERSIAIELARILKPELDALDSVSLSA